MWLRRRLDAGGGGVARGEEACLLRPVIVNRTRSLSWSDVCTNVWSLTDHFLLDRKWKKKNCLWWQWGRGIGGGGYQLGVSL